MNEIRQLYFVLSKVCNLSCNFCIRDYSINKKNSIDRLLFDIAIDKLKHLKDSTNLILSGGEPTLHPDFEYFLNTSIGIFNEVTINSNGTTKFFNTKILEDISQHKKIKVQISIDGSEHYHDSIRGKGSYLKSWETIKKIIKFTNINVTIATTVTNFSFLDSFKELYREISKFENLNWSIRRVSYAGTALISNTSYLPNHDWNRIVDHIKLQDSKNFIKIDKMYDFDYLSKISDDDIFKLSSRVIKNCGSGITKIYIYPNLDVLACTCYEKIPSGNLIRDNLIDILNSENHQYITNHNINEEPCVNCRYVQICNGGCIGSGFSRNNNIGQPDIKCPKVYDLFKNYL